MWTKFLVIAMFMLPVWGSSDEALFFKQYSAFLTKTRKHYINEVYSKARSPEQTTFRLKKMFDEAKLKNHRFVTKYDTLYIIEVFAAETPNIMTTVWDNHNNCYRYYYRIKKANKNKILVDTLEVTINEIKDAHCIDLNLERFVEKGDTAGFRQYNEKHFAYDGGGLNFTRAIKVKNCWNFSSSR